MKASVIIPLAALTLGFAAGRLSAPTPTSATITRTICHTDTVTRRDTLRITIPAPAPAPSVRYVTIRDTIRIPAQTRVYADSTFRAVVSGIDPRLDSLTIHPPLSIITRTLSHTSHPSRWGLGVTAGASLTPRGLSPSMSVGVTYTLVRF